MNTLKRKLTAILLTFAMLFSLMPVLPQAAEAATVQGNAGYVTLSYDNDGFQDRTITVNVMLADEQVDTIVVKDAKAATNQLSITVDNLEYELNGENAVSVDKDAAITLDSVAANFRSWSGVFTGNDITITVNLREKQERPLTPEGIYNGDAQYRLYGLQTMKLLHGEGVEVTEKTPISRAQLNFENSFLGYGDNEELIPEAQSGVDYRYAYILYNGGNGSPTNIESVTIQYGNSEEKTISADKLRFVLHTDEAVPYYTIEARDDNVHVLYFYNEKDGLSHYTPYAVRFVNHGETLKDMPADPEYNASSFEFVNWTIGGTKTEFTEYTVVDRDMEIYAEKVSSAGSGGTEIHVMNPNDEFLNRLVELYNAEHDTNITVDDIDRDTMDMSVTATDGTTTNKDYYDNQWKNYDGVSYYYVNNFDADYGAGTGQNTHVPFNDVAVLNVYFIVKNGQQQLITIPINSQPGNMGKVLTNVDTVIELSVNDPPLVPTEDQLEDPETGILKDGAVEVSCTTNTEHDNATYGLLPESYDVSEKAYWANINGEKAYYVDVVVNNEKYVEAYNKENEGHSIDGDATKTITLRWDNNAWIPVTNLPVTFTVKCDDPTPATYSLKYNVNGGTFKNTLAETAVVDNLVAGEYTLWAKDQSVTNDTQPDDETAWPTHDKDNDTDVVMIGWTAEKVAKIYAKGDAKPNVITTATITNTDVTVYAVWGYDTNGNDIPDVEENWYTLTYDANGGNSDSVPVDSNTYAKDQEVTLDKKVPTHAKKDGKDVVFIGWSMTKPTKEVYAAGEDFGPLVDKVTFDNDNIIVYAVWGYDENGDGIADATQVMVIPADITIYTGGNGYSGVTDADGDLITSTETTTGLPEPGYHFILPASAGNLIGENLSDQLTFSYNNGQEGADKVTRNWNITYVGIYATDENNEPTQYVYSIEAGTTESGSTIPVRLTYFNDLDGDGKYDANEVVQTDDIPMGETLVSDQYSMTINSGGLNQGSIIATLDSTDYSVGVGTGTLTVKSTVTKEDNTSEIVNSTDEVNTDAITAVHAGAKYYVNDSEVTIDQERVQLLVDEVSNSADFNAAIENDAVNKSSIENDNAATKSAYIDLVDNTNGNTVITMNGEMTILWPAPEDAASDSRYEIIHYTDMDRLSTVATGDLVDMETEKISGNLVTVDGKNYIQFETTSFSPFVLVYETDDGSEEDPGTDNPPYNPDPWVPTPDDGDGPDGLNTEDHFSYVVGYEDGMVKPQRSITRAEVATIFYRLLEDDVRDDYDTTRNNFSDVTSDSWYNQTVSTLASMGILKGYEDGTFRPNASITRAEFAAIATRFFEETGATYEPGTFTDMTGDEWFAGAIMDAVNLGLIGGYEDGTVRPNNNITRAEACAIVNRTLGRVPDADHLLPADEMTTWPDNPSSAWFYADMQEATNGHEYEWITEDGNKIEEWTDILDKDWNDR